MELLSINSARAAAIGYDADTQTVRVRFHDGAIYDYQPVTAEAYARGLHGGSIGAWIGTLGPGKRAEAVSPVAPQPSRRLAAVDEDRCCHAPLVRAIRDGKMHSDTWVCKKCSTEWRKETVNGVEHWSPRVDFMVVPL